MDYNNISLGLVYAIAKMLAQKYAGLGIKNVALSNNNDYIIFTMTDDSEVQIATTNFLLKGVYDENNDGVVNDSDKLGGNLAQWYIDYLNLHDADIVTLHDTIDDIIAGSYITVANDSLILLNKSSNGVVINDGQIQQSFGHINNEIGSMSGEISGIKATNNSIIAGNYLTAGSGISLTKSSNGVVITNSGSGSGTTDHSQ